VKILIAFIHYNDSNEFSVEYQKSENFSEVEYVRLFLHYYAKILCNFDPSDAMMKSFALFLKQKVTDLLLHKFTSSLNILEKADIDDVVKIIKSKPTKYKTIEARFIFNNDRRAITTIFQNNITCNLLLFSIFVLLQEIVHLLSERNIHLLFMSLKYMQNKYEQGIDFSNVNNLIILPNEAFIVNK